MTWTSPPPSVVAFRDALISTATVANTVLNGLTLPQMQARFHYPRADVRTDAMPAFVLRRIKRRSTRVNAIGTWGHGTVIAHLYIADGSIDDGTIEAYADAICDDLTSEATADVLYVTDAESGECVESSPGMVAAGVGGQIDEQTTTFRVVSITAEWEG
jgi:hypothetical protein